MTVIKSYRRAIFGLILKIRLLFVLTAKVACKFHVDRFTRSSLLRHSPYVLHCQQAIKKPLSGSYCTCSHRQVVNRFLSTYLFGGGCPEISGLAVGTKLSRKPFQTISLSVPILQHLRSLILLS